MKKIISLYRQQLRSCTQAEVTNPFLCINIMCPVGSYDPNVEPTKDDVLFTAEEEILEAITRFFHDVYGSLAERQQVLSRSLQTQTVIPTDLAYRQSQISNTTAGSQLSDLDPVSSPSKEYGLELDAQSTRSNVRSPDLSSIPDIESQQFVDISMTQQATGGRGSQYEDVEFDTQDMTEEEGEGEAEACMQPRNPWDVARMVAANSKQPRKTGSYLNQKDRTMTSFDNTTQPKEMLAASKSSGFLAINQEDQNLGIHGHNQGLRFKPFKCPSNIKPGTFSIPPEKGPMDAYLRPRPENTATTFAPPIQHPPSLSGTPLSQILSKSSLKRKQPPSTDITTNLNPTKQPRLSQHTAISPPHPRVSFAPKFSSSQTSPPSSANHRTTLLNQGLTTPDPSPLKRRSYNPHSNLSPSKQTPNIYLSQQSPPPPQPPQFPTPKSTSTYTSKPPILILTPTSPLNNPTISKPC